MKHLLLVLTLIFMAPLAYGLTDVEYNRAFSKANGIPYNAKSNQAADRQYFKTLIRNNRAGGG